MRKGGGLRRAGPRDLLIRGVVAVVVDVVTQLVGPGVDVRAAIVAVGPQTRLAQAVAVPVRVVAQLHTLGGLPGAGPSVLYLAGVTAPVVRPLLPRVAGLVGGHDDPVATDRPAHARVPRRARAGPALLHLAAAVAAVALGLVAVVAALALARLCGDRPLGVAADRLTGAPRGWAEPSRLGLAVLVAAVPALGVLVVTALHGSDDGPITAHGRALRRLRVRVALPAVAYLAAHARLVVGRREALVPHVAGLVARSDAVAALRVAGLLVRPVADPPRRRHAVAGTAGLRGVVEVQVTGVAFLPRLADPVAAGRRAEARHHRVVACPAVFHRAAGRAAVPLVRVSIVAGLVGHGEAVPAVGGARGPLRIAAPSLRRVAGRTALHLHPVPGVAVLAAHHETVPAGLLAGARAPIAAPAGLLLARRRAPVPREGVSVIARLDGAVGVGALDPHPVTAARVAEARGPGAGPAGLQVTLEAAVVRPVLGAGLGVVTLLTRLDEAVATRQGTDPLVRCRVRSGPIRGARAVRAPAVAQGPGVHGGPHVHGVQAARHVEPPSTAHQRRGRDTRRAQAGPQDARPPPRRPSPHESPPVRAARQASSPRAVLGPPAAPSA